MSKRSPFRYFRTIPEFFRLAVMLYVQLPLSLWNVEDLLHERGIETSHETVGFWCKRFGPMFAAEIRRKRVSGMHSSRWRWCWHLGEVFLKVNGVQHQLWRAVDHEGEVLEAFVSKQRDKNAALGIVRGNRTDNLQERMVRRSPVLPLGFEPRNYDPVPRSKRGRAIEGDPARFL
jgi:putative transposase